jgi:hypothetical protein
MKTETSSSFSLLVSPQSGATETIDERLPEAHRFGKPGQIPLCENK